MTRIAAALVAALVLAGAANATNPAHKISYWSTTRMGLALAGPSQIEGVDVTVTPDPCTGLGHFTLSRNGTRLYHRFRCTVVRQVNGATEKVTANVRTTGPFTFVVSYP